MRLRYAALLTLTLFAFLHSSVQAQNADAAEQFRAGSTAFQAGDYSSALNDFEAALAGGMTGPAVHFNIGVSAYRLGRYDRAHQAFEIVARTPTMAGLAYYNLGLVELQRNDDTAATAWFARVAPATEDEQLRQLASARLAELHPLAPPPERKWIGYAALGIGHDDNVALVSNSEVLGISDAEDNFAEAQLAFSVPLASAWRIDAGLTAVNYQE
ncbi:tetratricopeptide repeat protein, partial [Steroidobacter sp.]|uniref:tetratricopeptide repeat protein n=1 Tax=Steroidobacter sp. TaxID=1978227 RepID=UPI001A60C199